MLDPWVHHGSPSSKSCSCSCCCCALQVSQTLAKSEPAAAGGLVKVYETELKRLGALPLVHHARSPELLQCWTAS